MLEITVFTPATSGQAPSPVQSLTGIASGLNFGTAIPGGFSSCSFSLGMAPNVAYEWYARMGGHHLVVTDGGHVVWEGRIDSIGLEPFGVTVSCVGYWASLTDRYGTQWWSDSQFDSWREPSFSYITAAGLPVPAWPNGKFAITKDGGIFVGLRNPETYYANEAAGFVYILPIAPEGVAANDFWMNPGTIKWLELELQWGEGTWDSGRPAAMEVRVYTTPDYEVGEWTEHASSPLLNDDFEPLRQLVLPTGTKAVLLRIGPRLVAV